MKDDVPKQVWINTHAHHYVSTEKERKFFGYTKEYYSADTVQPLIDALRLGLEYWEHRQQRYKNRHPVWVEAAQKALEGFE